MTSFRLRFLLHHFWKSSIPTTCHSQKNSPTLTGMTGKTFFSKLWLQKPNALLLLLLCVCCGGSISPILCPHSLSRATEYGRVITAKHGGIVELSVGITEISGVCICTVFGGGPTFAALVLFVGVEGQWQPSTRRTCWRRKTESN